MKTSILREATKSVHVLSLGFGAMAVLSQGLSLAVIYWLVKSKLGAGYLGVWALIQAVFVFGRIAEFGLSQSLLHFLPKAANKNDPELAQRYFDTVLLASTLLFCTLALVMYVPAKAILLATIEPIYHPLLNEIFPYVLGSFIIMNIAQSGLNGLIGAQKAYLAHLTVIVSFVINMLVVAALINQYGLISLAYGGICSAVISLLISNILVSRNLGTRFLIPFRFRFATLREMLSIGAGIQAISLLSAIADSTIKFFVNLFVGIEAVGIFEMASKFVLTARGIFALPQNYLGSYFGNMANANREEITAKMTSALRLSLNLALIFIALVLVAKIWVGQIWVGAEASVFESFSLILTIGWFFNILVSPVYFALIGFGKLKIPVISQLIFATGVVISCMVIGDRAGASGLVLGFSLSLASSQICILIAGVRVIETNLRALANFRLSILIALLIAVAWIVPYSNSQGLGSQSTLLSAMGFGAIGLSYLVFHIIIDGSFLRYFYKKA